jgi:hypothetical protein
VGAAANTPCHCGRCTYPTPPTACSTHPTPNTPTQPLAGMGGPPPGPPGPGMMGMRPGMGMGMGMGIGMGMPGGGMGMQMRRPGGVPVAKATTVYVGKIATTVPDNVIKRLLEACGTVRAEAAGNLGSFWGFVGAAPSAGKNRCSRASSQALTPPRFEPPTDRSSPGSRRSTR